MQKLDIEAVRRQANLVAIVSRYTSLRKQGAELIALCPFHKEKSPSFTITPDKNLYKCFGCGEGGDVFAFIQKMESLRFPEAVKRVAELSGMPGAPISNDVPEPKREPGPIVAVYDYVDEEGVLLYQVCRRDPKDFTQRRPGPNGSYIENLGDVRRVLYRLPAVIAAPVVCLVEGEKDVHTLESLGFTATTNSGGANGKWPIEFDDVLKNKTVYIFPDNDDPGLKRADLLAKRLRSQSTVKIIKVPEPHKDVTDFVAAGATAEQLIALTTGVPEILRMVDALANPDEAYFLIGELVKADSIERNAAITRIYQRFAFSAADKRRFEKQLAAEMPRRQADAEWKAELLTSSGGETKPLLANAIAALRAAPEWAGVLAYDEFAMQTIILREFPGGDRASGPWSDRDDVSTADWMQHQGIFVKPDTVSQAVELVAKDATFHPVRDYLDTLKWDGTARVGSWLVDYLGAIRDQEDSEDQLPIADVTDNWGRYISYVGACWLIAAVARIYRPGCKVDTSLILEGPQGARKSTALKILGGKWFTDELADLGSKDAAMQTRGIWVIEIAELDSMGRAEVSNVKAFLSRTTDRFRPPYGRRLIESPRQCIFAGTVNHSTYLKDETGARRFWPVQCSAIDIEGLTRDRDQLWAEALYLFRGDVKWWIEGDELNLAAHNEQSKRYAADPWDEVILTWLESGAKLATYPDTISVSEIMEGCLKIERGRWSQMDSNRVARCLKAAGWEKYRQRKGASLEWRYRHVPAHKDRPNVAA